MSRIIAVTLQWVTDAGRENTNNILLHRFVVTVHESESNVYYTLKDMTITILLSFMKLNKLFILLSLDI